MAHRAAESLHQVNIPAYVMPAIPFAVTEFALGFPGAVTIKADTETAFLQKILDSLLAMNFRCIAIANAHLEPGHLRAIHAATDGDDRLIFPDITRKPWALQLTDEFKRGMCHAGQFETSLVMADAPDLVREEIRTLLPDVPISLSTGIREEKTSFKEMGSKRAYFGFPRNATADEGRRTLTF